MHWYRVFVISKIQLVVHYKCCVLIGRATTRLYVTLQRFQRTGNSTDEGAGPKRLERIIST